MSKPRRGLPCDACLQGLRLIAQKKLAQFLALVTSVEQYIHPFMCGCVYTVINTYMSASASVPAYV